jgi:serine/threonine protein kinase
VRLEDLFDLQEKLSGSGSHNQVFGAKCRQSGADVIVKVRGRQFAVGGEAVWRSLLTRMLNLERHSHVLGIKDVLEDDEMYYIVMDRCSGGELFAFLQTEIDVPEKECKRIMREILEAVDHMHSKGLIHRDIKPENIMFHDTTSDPLTPKPEVHQKAIKLIDFDTCQEYASHSPRAKHLVGSMGYIAPEALKGDYSPASDLWSVGVIFYILMTGGLPFGPELFTNDPGDTRCCSASMNCVYMSLKGAQIDFDCDPWTSVPQARDLCQQLLAFSPEDRTPSARAALRHPWLGGDKTRP